MKLYSSGLSGQIRIGTVISIQRNFLPRLLNAFREEFGDGIVFDIHQDTTYGCIKGLRDGKFDVAFCGKLRDEQGITYTPMVSQNLVIGVDASHETRQARCGVFGRSARLLARLVSQRVLTCGPYLTACSTALG